MMRALKVIVIFSVLALSGCRSHSSHGKEQAGEKTFPVPEWSKHAVWYQIFVERFRNGDPSNDPTVADMQGGYPGTYPAGWSVTPWGHDWYSPEPWLSEMKQGGFYQKIQARRYGGDLKGVLDKISYLADLGITAVYFNPLNDSPSLHKYDARNYAHIDRNFGPDPAGDAALIATEIHDDPATWHRTSADSLFLKVVDELHKHGIKVILDYSWNHTGRDFWALNDVHAKGASSKYADWYNIISFDDPATPADEFRYEGWGGGNIYMPVFRKDIIPPEDKVIPFEGNLHSASLRKHIFDVTRRWLDPDGNGDPSDGVDGFRLDVAAEVPMGFWREYREFVRSVNPEAYLVGEIWWLEWPDKLLDPVPFLGSQFDAIMNYRWFRIARGFFGQAEPILRPSEFVAWVNKLDEGISPGHRQAMMNVAGTHDSPRLLTSLFNKGLDKYRAKPSDDPDYKIYRPGKEVFREEKLFLIHQFTFPGAPHIWYGEEVGMWGADDPDCRKPMLWDDITFEVEKAHFYPAKERPADTVKPDAELRDFYKSLIKMRRENPVLATGSLEFLLADDQKMTLAYKRKLNGDEIIAAFNRSDKEQELSIPSGSDSRWEVIFPAGLSKEIRMENKTIFLKTDPVSGIVLRKIK